jgi:FkbM family methyltransferase
MGKLHLLQGLKDIKLRNGLVLKADDVLARWGQIFEPAIADLYGVNGARPDIVVDVGANIGAFACLAAYLNPKAVVHAFEPQAEAMGFLKANASTNGITNIVCHQEVVTSDGREVVFHTQKNKGACGLFRLGESGEESMPSTTLAQVSFAGMESLFLKMDCEGTEGELVEWVAQNEVLLPSRTVIAAEWHHWCPLLPNKARELLEHKSFAVSIAAAFGETYLRAERHI